jgi:hypothetical protein
MDEIRNVSRSCSAHCWLKFGPLDELRLNGFVEGKNLAVIPGSFESIDDNLAERAAASGY